MWLYIHFHLDLFCWPQCINVKIPCSHVNTNYISHTTIYYCFSNKLLNLLHCSEYFHSIWFLADLLWQKMNSWNHTITNSNKIIQDYPPPPATHLPSTKLSSVYAISDKQQNKDLIVTHLFCKYHSNYLINIWYCLSLQIRKTWAVMEGSMDCWDTMAPPLTCSLLKVPPACPLARRPGLMQQHPCMS